MRTDRLLADYAQGGSEEAFRSLVAAYLDLVYSTAARLTGGDMHLAEDVAQTVFIDLARLAKSLSREVRLGGWLHRHTCFIAAKALRAERRRQNRERQAVEMNESTDHSQARLAEIVPVLDEAINQLGASDRAAVLLRFYERLDFRSVGEELGINEAAAQKRVNRAVEKLHVLLTRRGVILSLAALTTALAAEAVEAAPAGLVASISAKASAAVATGTVNFLTSLRYMASTKLKTSIAGAVILASVLTPLFMQRQAQASLRELDHTLAAQTHQLEQLKTENQRLAALAKPPQNAAAPPDAEFRELLRLRGEVGRLKEIARKMSDKNVVPLSPQDQIASLKRMYAARVDRLKQWGEDHPSAKIPEFQYLTDENWLQAVETLSDDASERDFQSAAGNLRANAEHVVLDRLHAALRAYVVDYPGQFPTALSQLAPYLAAPIDAAALARYEIVSTSTLVPELQGGGDWAITQIAPVDPELDIRNAFTLTSIRSADERISNRWSSITNP